MPMNRNTRSKGAPKRSASRLDRMPAMTRTAPRRIAILTESREAISPDKSLQILAIASLSSPHFRANPLIPQSGKVPGFLGLIDISIVEYRWSARRPCEILPDRSNQADVQQFRQRAPVDGSARDRGNRPNRPAVRRRRGRLALVLFAVRPDPGRRRHRLGRGCRDPVACRHVIAGDALAD